ncbi:MAG: sigma-70 family RNA polymerase sigma factor [Nitrospirae bacterium]|nr:sigma-70 family RNA polymerase sigma factor [Nitrospirota bacterium]
MGATSPNLAFFDDLFREQYAKIASALLRKFGPDHLDGIESAIQEAFVKAIQLWPIKGTPEQPLNWIIRAAHNLLIDEMRHQKGSEPISDEIVGVQAEEPGIYLADEVTDDDIRMLFLCCHPVLPIKSQVALLLKTACGFSVTEIARAFLAKEETIEQRLVRAKQKIRTEGVELELPRASDLPERLGSVAMGLYLLFNEGYSVSEGDHLVREELCDEAIDLTRKLTQHRLGKTPTIYALMALFLFHRARIKTRTDSDGNILLLKDQDRVLWDKEFLREGARYFSLSMQEDQLSKYHLEAGIAACHAFAPSWEQTDWAQILSYYELLEKLSPSPVVTLNRIAATLMGKGAHEALRELNWAAKALEGLSYYMYPAVAGEIQFQLGEKEKAADYYQSALKLVRTTAERNFLLKRIRELG